MDGLDPCRARALYLSGLKTPNDVLRAPEEVIKKALSKALPSEMKRHDDVHVQKGTHAAVQVGLGAHIGANTLLNRSVQSVTSMVHKHLWQKAADQHLELPDPQDAPVQLTQATELSTCPASVPGPRCIPAHAQRLTQGPTWPTPYHRVHPLMSGLRKLLCRHRARWQNAHGHLMAPAALSSHSTWKPRNHLPTGSPPRNLRLQVHC